MNAYRDQDVEVQAFDSTPGGVMTDEVGAITGTLEVWLEGEKARIRYQGALDVYTIAGLTAGRSLAEVLEVLTTDPGPDEFGNAKTVDLNDPA